MKRTSLKNTNTLPPTAGQALDELQDIWTKSRRQKLPRYLFLALCFNLVLAPVVYAAAGNELTRHQAWALGLLGLGTFVLSIYLFFVMFTPEKF